MRHPVSMSLRNCKIRHFFVQTSGNSVHSELKLFTTRQKKLDFKTLLSKVVFDTHYTTEISKDVL